MERGGRREREREGVGEGKGEDKLLFIIIWRVQGCQLVRFIGHRPIFYPLSDCPSDLTSVRKSGENPENRSSDSDSELRRGDTSILRDQAIDIAAEIQIRSRGKGSTAHVPRGEIMIDQG